MCKDFKSVYLCVSLFCYQTDVGKASGRGGLGQAELGGSDHIHTLHDLPGAGAAG